MLTAQKITKTFNTTQKVTALSGVNLKIEAGDFLLIKGKSGSGKSTLLFILGGMLSPTSGEVYFNGVSLYNAKNNIQDTYRGKKVGFVFQGTHLLPYLNVVENIALGLQTSRQKIEQALIKKTAEEVGLVDRLFHKPSELSVGEQQRVALARSLIKKPAIVFADEPTGNLDKENSLMILKHLQRYQKKGGVVVMVTHRDLADAYATEIFNMQNGTLNSIKN